MSGLDGSLEKLAYVRSVWFWSRLKHPWIMKDLHIIIIIIALERRLERVF